MNWFRSELLKEINREEILSEESYERGEQSDNNEDEEWNILLKNTKNKEDNLDDEEDDCEFNIERLMEQKA